jgi:hypothetical protein
MDLLRKLEGVSEAEGVPERPRKPLAKRLMALGAAGGISVGIIAWMIHGINQTAAQQGNPQFSVRGIYETWAESGFLWLLACGVFHLFGYCITAWRWRTLLRAQGYLVKYPPLIASFLTAGFFNNILPSIIGGDLILAYDSATRIGNGYRTVPVLVVARMCGLLALMTISLSAVLVKMSLLLSAQLDLSALWGFMIPFSLVVLGLIVAVQPRIANAIENLMDRLPVVRKVSAKLKTIFGVFRAYRERKRYLFAALAISVLFNLNVVTYYYAISWVLGLNVAPLDMLVAGPIVIMMMMVLPSVNGIGVRDKGFSVMLGLDPRVAITYACVDLGLRILYGLVGGVVFLIRVVLAQSRPLERGNWVIAYDESAGKSVECGMWSVE